MTLNISRTLHANDPQPSPDVHHVQARLVGKGYSVGSFGIDGHFGAASETATKRFQAHVGLDDDGVVGPKTLAALDRTVAYQSISAAEFADRVYRRVCGLDGGARPRYSHDEVANLGALHPMAMDCSEAMQWGVYQEAHTAWVDGSWNQAAHCKIVSVDVAARTKGALLFISHNGYPSGVHHVAASMGKGRSDPHGTAEMRSAYMTPNGGTWAIGDRFDFGGIVPVLHYP